MEQEELGYVISSQNYLAYLDGLPTIKVNDLVVNDQGVQGLVNTILPNRAEVFLLNEGVITPGQTFRKTGKKLSLAVGDFLLGRSINPLGVPIDGRGHLAASTATTFLELDQPAKGIQDREFITEQLVTGVTLVDSLVPLGKGQRELIIGDSHSGKTEFLIDVLINLKNSNVICIYAAIGKPATYIKNLMNTIEINGASHYTVLVATASTEPTPLIVLTPKAAFCIAEYFQSQGHDVLVILNDMGNHAKIYRELSLIGGKPPGRESYPGDIFFTHASLLERAGNFNKTAGGGSISALPVIELNLTDFTGFIPTNLMSITDGHLMFKANLYNKNQRPAVDISLSVSRVGRQTQAMVISMLSRLVRQVLGQAADLETLSRFSEELPPATQLILRQKGLIEEILKQESLINVPLAIQTILLGLVFSSFLRDKDSQFLKIHKKTLIESFGKDPELRPITDSVLKLANDKTLIDTLEKTVGKLNLLCK